MKKPEKNNILLLVRNFSIENSLDNDIHGFEHTKRVYNTSITIGKSVGANLFILKIATLLHDIGRTEENQRVNINHAEQSANMAMQFIKKSNFGMEKNEIDNIIQSIKAHSFSNKIKPKTLEAKVLSDADKLDALGAIGLYRTIGYTINNNGNLEDVLEHLKIKILQLDKQLYLEESRKIAKERIKIVKSFYNYAHREIKSEEISI